jgi:hypothetical protein
MSALHDVNWCGVSSGVSWAYQWRTCDTEPLDSRHLMFRSQMSIADCHLNGLVSHELLSRSQVNASHYKPTGESVPQTVPCEAFDSSFLDCWLEPVSALQQTVAVTICKHVAAAGRIFVQLGERSKSDTI